MSTSMDTGMEATVTLRDNGGSGWPKLDFRGNGRGVEHVRLGKRGFCGKKGAHLGTPDGGWNAVSRLRMEKGSARNATVIWVI